MVQKLYKKKYSVSTGERKEAFGITESGDFPAYETAKVEYSDSDDCLKELANYLKPNTKFGVVEFKNLEKTIMEIQKEDRILVVSVQQGLTEEELEQLALYIAFSK